VRTCGNRKEDFLARRGKIKKADDKMIWKSSRMTTTFERVFILASFSPGVAAKHLGHHFPHFKNSTEFLRLLREKKTHTTPEFPRKYWRMPRKHTSQIIY
jgi:hypothetical protein